MEIFYSNDVFDGRCVLDAEEAGHCVRVLRHREGDSICVIDGLGTMYDCRIVSASPKEVEAVVEEVHKGWGAHAYSLTMAVCPTKNNDRFEWFAEKATEIGVDEIVPVIGERSERRVFKGERVRKILLSAAKQSLKGAIPALAEPVSVRDFIAAADPQSLRLIAYCFEGDTARISIEQALDGYFAGLVGAACSGAEGAASCQDCSGVDGQAVSDAAPLPKVTVMIGPEGDFSPAEAEAAVAAGFIPIHIGSSRLRTETAALASVMAVYLKAIDR